MAVTENRSSHARILAYLRHGRTLSTAQASARFGVTPDTVRARVCELKKAGYSIYSNERNGKVVYRMGRPVRREIVAGRILLSDPVLLAAFESQINKNLSLV